MAALWLFSLILLANITTVIGFITRLADCLVVKEIKGKAFFAGILQYSAHVPCPEKAIVLLIKEFDNKLPPLFTTVPDPSNPKTKGGFPIGYLP